MPITRYFRLFLLVVLLTSCGTGLQAATRTLDIYFIDVEGGAATLIVSPLGDSLLVDSGFPGERDADRILHVAREVAGLKQIDHYVTTHWHRDHFGGVLTLAKLFPIKHYYDHGLPTASAPDIQPELIAAYRETVHDQSVTLKVGDQIALRSLAKTLAPIKVQILAGNGIVLGEQPGAAQVQLCGSDFHPIPEDTTDNNKSLGFLLRVGKFKFFDGGDLTWNIENRLACPKNLAGEVDVYQANHHGVDNSNNPALVKALNPKVAIIGNGPRKGGEPRTFATLKSVPAIEAIYQLHRNMATTDMDNASRDFVANDAEECQANFIKISVATDGKSYTVNIPAKQISRTYKTR